MNRLVSGVVVAALPLIAFVTLRRPVARALVLEQPSMAIAVAVVALSVIALGIWVKPRTFAGSLSKWLLCFAHAVLIVAYLVCRFGNPLAGVIYWVNATVFLSLLVPLSIILADVEMVKANATGFAAGIGALGLFIALLCTARI